MNTIIKDRIKGYTTFAFCLALCILAFANSVHAAKPVTWHVILLPLLPPIIYPTW